MQCQRPTPPRASYVESSVVTIIDATPDPKTPTPKATMVPSGEVYLKYERDNKIARGTMLQHMSDPLFDIFVVHKFAKIT